MQLSAEYSAEVFGHFGRIFGIGRYQFWPYRSFTTNWPNIVYLADFHIIHSTQIGNIFPLKSIHFSKPILLIEIKYDVITKRRGIGLHKRGDGGSICVAAASTRVGQLGTICRNWWLLLTPTKVMNGFLIPMCHVQPCASEDDRGCPNGRRRGECRSFYKTISLLPLRDSTLRLWSSAIVGTNHHHVLTNG